MIIDILFNICLSECLSSNFNFAGNLIYTSYKGHIRQAYFLGQALSDNINFDHLVTLVLTLWHWMTQKETHLIQTWSDNDTSVFQTCAGLVTDDHLAEGRVYPPLSEIQNVSLTIATELGEMVYMEDLASLYPEPRDKKAQIWSGMYSTDYESFEPETWDWPNN